MRTGLWSNVVVAIAAASLAGAVGAKPANPPPPPPDGTLIGGCDSSLTTPDASACAGYYTGNILNGSPADITNQENAIASLPGSFTWDGDWKGLDTAGNVITSLTGTNEIDFGKMLYGQTIVGAHFGNIQDNTGGSGNVSVFWLFDFGTAGAGSISLDHTRGFSNAALYTTGTPPSGVPEPATWAMMLIGFGAAGAGLRRRRAKERKLQSCRA
jgi:hypothetical protein